MIKSRLLVYGIMVSMLLGAGFIDAAAEKEHANQREDPDTDKILAVLANMPPNMSEYFYERNRRTRTPAGKSKLANLTLGNLQFAQAWEKTYPEEPYDHPITNRFSEVTLSREGDVMVELVPIAE